MNNKEMADIMRRREVPVEQYIDASVMDHVLGFEPLPDHVVEVVKDKPGVLFQAIELAKTALQGVNSSQVEDKFTQLSKDVKNYQEQENAKNGYWSSATRTELPGSHSRSAHSRRSGSTMSMGDRSGYAF